MSEFRKYPRGNSRQIINFANVVDGFDQWGLYCIDKGIMSIIRYLISTRGLYRTSYAMSYGPHGYYSPDDNDFSIISNRIADFLAEEDMTCDLTAGLAGIENAIRSIKPCASTYNETSFDGQRWSRGGPLGQNPTSFGGVGDLFESLGAYEASKCNKAAWLIDGLIQAVGNVGTISLVEAIAGTVGLAGISIAFFSNPPVAVLAALAIAVGVSFGLSELCVDVQAYLTDHRQELICAVYNADNAEAAYDAIDTVIDTAIAYVGLAVGQEALSMVYMSYVDVDTISQVYSNSDALVSAGGANCSGCSVYSVPYGVEEELALALVGSVCHPTLGCDHQYLSVSFSTPVTIHSISVAEGSWGGYTNAYQYYSPAWHGENSFSEQSGVVGLELAGATGSTTPFKLVITWSVD